ncbi:MAG: 2-C-methyl-D-erythritol 4-phosphate cytidylyltransferase [Kiritimatiellia bacterium]|jgi:2-C-methyl-D-erythritol 4-phosphate cytidylyltransferase
MITAIIVAAGKSTRMGGDIDKAFLSLGSKPVLAYSMMAFETCPEVGQVILVVRKEQLVAAKSAAQMFGCRKVVDIVAGGARRQDSVARGLAACDPATSVVCVHDGARPCITPALISETIRTAKRTGSGVAAAKVTDTLKVVERGHVVASTLDRTKVWSVQTPQTFKFDILRRALDKAAQDKENFTDEASAVEHLGEKVHLVPSTFPNIKITVTDDLKTAALLLGIH